MGNLSTKKKIQMFVKRCLWKVFCFSRWSTISLFSVCRSLIHWKNRSLWYCFKATYLSRYKNLVLDRALRHYGFPWHVLQFGVFSAPLFPVFGLNKEIYRVNLRIQPECEKIRLKKYRIQTLFAWCVFLWKKIVIKLVTNQAN